MSPATAPFELLCAMIASSLGPGDREAGLATAIAWEKVDWKRLVRMSGVHLLTPALKAPLASPILHHRVPEDLQLYLESMHDAARERNLALRAQLEDVAACLNQIEVVPVVLKGGIRLVDGLWPDPALRFMHDLDLLVPDSELWECVARLARSGWRPYDERRQDLAQHVILLHPEAVARIELHRQPLAAPYDVLLPAARMLARATPIHSGKSLVALPALEDQIVHLVAHGMLQHAFLKNGRFVLRELVELSLLLARASEHELTAARARFAAAGHRLAWEVSLDLCARCLGGQPQGETLLARALVTRMLLQQRWPWAMQLLGPLGWAASRLLVNPAARSVPPSARELAGRFRVFRRKTLW